MTPDSLIAFSLFSLAGSITPGPNNAMLMASGANFGVRATIPHMLGVAFGFGFLVLCAGTGLGAIFAAAPVLQDVMWAVGTLYLLWLSWKIATAKGVGGGASRPRPLTFLQAASFQWINPKAWTGALGAIATYAPRQDYFANLALIVALSVAIVLPVVLLWASMGLAVRRWLSRPGLLRAFNITMAVLLVISLLPPAWDHLSRL